MADKESLEATRNKSRRLKLLSFHDTDAGNAEAFELLHGHRFRYDHTKAKWLVWGGRSWAEDRNGEAHRAALTTVRCCLSATAAMGDSKEKTQRIQFALRSEATWHQEALLRSARSIRSLATVKEQYDRARVIAQNGASSPCYDADYYPFGAEAAIATNTCPQNYKFTGKERDSESGLDNFGARYNASNMGRFMSADPIFVHVLRVIDPQRLNLYAYARNNPLAFLDPTGKDIVSGTGDQKTVKAALVEIARHPGGREFLIKLDKLTVKIQVNTGSAEGGEAYGSFKGPFKPQKDAAGHVTDATGGPINLTVDFKSAGADRDLNKALKEQGEPQKPDVPSSDAELLGHELSHGENAIFGQPDSEAIATGRIDDILNTPVDKNLKKDADKFVDDLLKPNANNQQQPPSPTPCTPDKDKKCAN